MKILGKKVDPESKPHHRRRTFWKSLRNGLASEPAGEVLSNDLGNDNTMTADQILSSVDIVTGRPYLGENPPLRGYKI